MENSTIRRNLANGDGGGIYMENFQSLFIDLSLFDANESGNNGGGVYVLNSESFTVIDSTFQSNESSKNGGAISSYAIENIAITGSTFAGNHAVSGRGGGIHACNGNLYIVNSTFGGLYSGDTLESPQSARRRNLSPGDSRHAQSRHVQRQYRLWRTQRGSAIFADTGPRICTTR